MIKLIGFMLSWFVKREFTSRKYFECSFSKGYESVKYLDEHCKWISEIIN